MIYFITILNVAGYGAGTDFPVAFRHMVSF